MKLNSQDMYVYRGETFTIDRTVVNRDGSPYVVSSQYDNPYIVITVSNEEYRHNWWLDLSSLPRFKSTVPIKLNSFDALPLEYEPDDALFYCEINGKNVYKYYDEELERFMPYEFRIVKAFTTDDTSEWVSQNYTYTINLVAGSSTEDYIDELCNEYKILTIGLLDKYNALKNIDEELVSSININKPIHKIFTKIVILEPSKLYVLSNEIGE